MDRVIIDLGHRDKLTELEVFIEETKIEQVKIKIYKNFIT